MFEFIIKEKLQSNKDLIKALDNIKYKTNQIKWVKLMNNYKNIIEEIILNELIYK